MRMGRWKCPLDGSSRDAMTKAMVRGSGGCVLVKALVFLMAGTTDGAVSLTSLTVPTRPDSYDVLPLVKWPSPMLGSRKELSRCPRRWS